MREIIIPSFWDQPPFSNLLFPIYAQYVAVLGRIMNKHVPQMDGVFIRERFILHLSPLKKSGENLNRKTMLMRILKVFHAIGCLVLFDASITVKGALTLTGTSYEQNFNAIGSGLPTGWNVATGATVSSVGTSQSFTTTAKTWGDNSGSFKNLASSDELTSGASTTAQSTSTDRALGIRQTESFGDPGAAFELNIQNTSGLDNFSLSISLQMLSVQGYSTTWTIDYRVGDSGNFTTLGTYSDPGTFGSTTFTADSTDLSSWNNQSQDIWFRVFAPNAATGSGSRDTFGMGLNYNVTLTSEFQTDI